MSDELSSDARAVIRGAVAQESSIDAAGRARLKRALFAKAALLAPEAAQAAQIAAPGASLGSALTASKLGILAAKGAGAGLLVAVTLQGVSHFAAGPAARHPAVSAPRVRANDASERPGAPAAAHGRELVPAHDGVPPKAVSAMTPQALAGPPIVAGAAPPASGSAGTSLSSELLLMAEVQRALRDGRPARALELVARHAAAFPEGQLVNERLAAEAFAACQSGDVSRARHAAALFLARDATSSLAERVRKTCPPAGP
jgi:hypothetical protein